MYLPDRAVRIAGKPAPTGYSSPTESVPCQDPLWERACSRWHRRGVPARPRRPHRRQPAPTGQAWPTESTACQGPLWERACSRWHRRGVPARPHRPHRRQASSHRSGMASSHMKRRRTLSQTCYHSATFLSYPPAILTPLLRTRGYERPVCQHAHDTPNLVNVSP